MSTLDGMSEIDDSRPVMTPPVVPAVERLTRRETLMDVTSVFAWVLASDLLLYHSGGYAAWALFVIVAAAILLLVRRKLGALPYTLAVMGMLLLCSLRLAWCGSVPAAISSVGLVIALSMSINGTPPFLPDMLQYFLHVLVGSGARMSRFSLRGSSAALAKHRARFGVLLPLVVVVAFSTIFVLANPDIAKWLDEQFRLTIDKFGKWLDGMDPLQFAFWFLSGWLAIGLFHPLGNYLIHTRLPTGEVKRQPSDNYVAVRNMMISVVLLFAVYLVFEFATLWFREFPEGFYYAGYAHEGAFWLTVALALSTLILSVAFSGSIVADQRVKGLKRWAWIWSIENFLLGAAVFHRLFIYIDFNGMTRMRVIGLLGTLAVVIGFGLVVIKISRSRGFLWLIRHQLWTVALAAILYTILPVDYCVHRYNASQILSGNPAPSTQIPTHETSAEGLLPLVALLDSNDQQIRIGIAATLADWLVETPVAQDWRDNQWAHQVLRERLREELPRLQPYLVDKRLRESAMANFYKYAYQWY